MISRLSMGALILAVAACSSAGHDPAPGAAPGLAACNALVIDAASYARALANHREDQMKLMRFASQSAMEAYVSETERLRAEAARVAARSLNGPPAGREPPDADVPLSLEEASVRISAADACADELAE